MVKSKSECDNNAIIKLHEIMCRFINSNLSRSSIYSYNNNNNRWDARHGAMVHGAWCMKRISSIQFMWIVSSLHKYQYSCIEGKKSFELSVAQNQLVEDAIWIDCFVLGPIVQSIRFRNELHTGRMNKRIVKYFIWIIVFNYV